MAKDEPDTPPWSEENESRERSGIEETSTASGGSVDEEYGTDYGTEPTGGDRQARDFVYCTNCGEEIDAKAEICPECGVRQGGTSPSGSSGSTGSDEQDPAVSALLSLIIPGAGQLINGQAARGLAAFVGVFFVDTVLFFFGFLLMYFLIGFFFFLLVPVVHAVVAWDAYDQAQKINAGEVVVD